MNMENLNENIDYQKIEEMVEGDEDFRRQLLEAITLAIEELREVYLQALEEENMEALKQARHKIKPTLSLFGLKRLTKVLYLGKKVILEEGFRHTAVNRHKEELYEASEDLLNDLKTFH
jgi:HPt (histidine-containing phosphotransfer) domain-containing protein